jgi:hypothetical protein
MQNVVTADMVVKRARELGVGTNIDMAKGGVARSEQKDRQSCRYHFLFE